MVNVHYVCKLDRELYRVVTADIRTDEVIITDAQIDHIKERHPGDYEAFSEFFPQIIAEPDYILATDAPNTAFVLKTFQVKNENFQLILRLATNGDIEGRSNSIITFLKVNDKKWRKYLRNKKILYSRLSTDV